MNVENESQTEMIFSIKKERKMWNIKKEGFKEATRT